MSFLNQIEASKKVVPKNLLKTIRFDTRSVTGKNIRMITLFMGRDMFSNVNKDDISRLSYFPIDENETWRVSLISEIIESNEKNLEVPGFNADELSEILNHACIS